MVTKMIKLSQMLRQQLYLSAFYNFCSRSKGSLREIEGCLFGLLLVSKTIVFETILSINHFDCHFRIYFSPFLSAILHIQL
ncbi:hypothetical protein AWH48_16440 [Domibacillus aminovorans]|uniref:Uncharacterized protein n=1 Tax=Domibacillus aminovorans TaxID=29332 RepID=A0A177KZX2_9BACI|nr:hypothetical protein AWH48_16440 [Domibacillus aminovorans]